MHKAFAVHMLNDTGKQKATALATAFDELLTKVQLTVPSQSDNGRECALVITHLELASFFAKKAMAVLSENQQQA
jgi:hypothetical protein